MSDILKKQFPEDYNNKMKIFYSLLSEIEKKNIEVLKEMKNKTGLSDYYLLKYHYTLIGPSSEQNTVSFKFKDNTDLPEGLQNQVLSAFRTAFELSE